MNRAEYIIQILCAQANVLKILASKIEIQKLEEALEALEKNTKAVPNLVDFPITPTKSDDSLFYSEIENAIQRLDLPAPLEPYLFSYPEYRAWIENSHQLGDELRLASRGEKVELIQSTLDCAESWLGSLGSIISIDAEIHAELEIPWRKFRAEVLKRLGENLFTPVRSL